MALPTTERGDRIFAGNVTFNGTLTGIGRTSITQESLSAYPIDLTSWRVWDAYQTALATAANDDLGITAGAFGTATPYITCGDINGSASAARYARFMVQLPHEYDAGQTIQINFFAGLVSGTASIGTVTIDLEARLIGATTGAAAGGSDLVTTATTTINSLTFADVPFTITETGLVPGDWLDCRVGILFSNDATARVPAITYAELLCDSKG